MYDYALYGSRISTLGTLGIIAILLAIIATVLAFIFIVPAKRREKMGKFGKFLHDACNFKFLIVEKILQALYIFFTALVILVGFFHAVLLRLERLDGRQGHPADDPGAHRRASEL